MAGFTEIPLGQATEYKDQYDPELLFPIARDEQWKARGVDRKELNFKGEDLWTAYEVSWLKSNGVPKVAIMQFRVPADTPNIIESKSFKLYLNSFNQTKVESEAKLIATLVADLSSAAGGPVGVELLGVDDLATGKLQGICIDEEEIEIDQYQPDASQLVKQSNEVVEETLISHLLKSNCPVTSQPDWATVQIKYKGPKIDRGSLLKYIVSYRTQNDFHEQCVESIFHDLMEQLQPEFLSVYARYTRRGGLDINPFRSSEGGVAPQIRLARQ